MTVSLSKLPKNEVTKSKAKWSFCTTHMISIYGSYCFLELNFLVAHMDKNMAMIKRVSMKTIDIGLSYVLLWAVHVVLSELIVYPFLH